jgi:hypothetical protein
MFSKMRTLPSAPMITSARPTTELNRSGATLKWPAIRAFQPGAIPYVIIHTSYKFLNL